ncbi:MAG: GNAT family N-acetyltransferase, partial [Chloroflexi bacterium]|nr:GNAT family N-acetyltransferase [Chloroflexota bacterium]
LGRHAEGTAVRPDASGVFMAASYPADYATLLCHPDDLGEVCAAVVQSLGTLVRASEPWDVIDLRRLRGDDPALPVLISAFAGGPDDWTVVQEQEEVCPVVTLPDGDWDDYLATLDKKARHEIRRKLRRAESVGEVTFRQMPLDAASVDAFIELHQKRWGEQGLFPSNEGGDRSRRLLHRVTEQEAAEGDSAQLQLGQVLVGDRVIFAGVGFDDGQTCYFYNAGSDTDARELSPGVTGAGAYIRDRIDAGRTRFDFLRGNEPYKYEWGAVDEPIYRIVVSRDPA